MPADSSPAPRFEITRQGGEVTFAEKRQGEVVIFRAQAEGGDNPAEIARWRANDLRNLLLWAEDERSVTFSLTGPLAKQVFDLAGELSLTPEMFVWHAVKVFIDTADAH